MMVCRLLGNFLLCKVVLQVERTGIVLFLLCGQFCHNSVIRVYAKVIIAGG